MKKLLLKFSILFALYFVTTNVYAQDLYLIIGQSNAAGRDLDIDPNGEDAMTNDVKYLADDRGFLKGRQPLNKYSGVRKDLDIQGVNLGLEFGKEMHKHTDNRVYLVVNARGGTKVAEWRKDNSSGYYADTKARVEQGEAECGCSLKGIVWHQGEGNVSSDGSFTSSYFASLNELIKELRDDFGNVPFIVGQLVQNDKNKKFNDAIRLVDDNSYEVSDVEWATSINLTAISGDESHFDAASTRLLGRRYAKRMKQFIAEGRAQQESIIAEKVAGRKVNLTWITNEVNAPIKYTIQHSTDEKSYTDLFTKSPRDGNSIEVYSDQHNTPSIGDNFYRLKIDYQDGTNKYIYQDENIFFNPIIKSVFPNPTKDVLYVDLSEFMGKSAVMTLYNIQGMPLKNVAVDTNHEEVVSINLNNFKNGIYSLQIKADDSKAISQKVMISNTY